MLTFHIILTNKTIELACIYFLSILSTTLFLETILAFYANHTSEE